MTTWVDLVARARGLSGRLLPPHALASLAAAPNLGGLAATLAGLRNRPAPETTPAAQDLDDAERRHEGAQLRLLARWAGPRAAILAPLYEEEDCRSLRAILRGSIARRPAAERLDGLIPTPALPVRALQVLAAAATPAKVAATLTAWGNPYGPALLTETARQAPDLFVLEHALVRQWARRARRVARRGGPALRRYVARRIDLANAWTALLAADGGLGAAAAPASLFVEGGDRIPRAAFEAAASARGRAAAMAVLDPLVRRTPLAAATAAGADAEARVQRALALEQGRLAAREPLGLAPVIAFWLRLRAEALAIRRAVWGLASGTPASERTAWLEAS